MDETARLRDLIRRHAGEGLTPTALPGVSLLRATAVTEPLGIAVSDASPALLDAIARLAGLLDEPDAAAVLAAGIEREILWRCSPARRGRPCGRSGSPTAALLT